MKKFIFIYFLVFIFSFGKNDELQYKDVPKNHWAYSAINNLIEEGVIPEDSFEFKGEEPITRYVFAEGLNKAFEKLDNKKANRGDLVIIESLVYEFSKELTKIGFDTETFNGKIENFRTDIEILRKKVDENELTIKELEKRIKVLEEKEGI